MHERTVEDNYGQTLPRLLTINDTAEMLGVARSTVYGLIHRGDLRPVRVGRRLRFRVADLDAYLTREDPP